MTQMAMVLALAAQVLVTVQPGEQVDVTCAGVVGTVAVTAGRATVPCEAAPDPEPVGTVVPGDAIEIRSGVLVHESSGFFLSGPGSAARRTAEGAYQVDDRPGGWFFGLGCVLATQNLTASR